MHQYQGHCWGPLVVDQGTCHETDIKLIESIQVILVLQARLSVYAEIAIRHAKRPKHDLGI